MLTTDETHLFFYTCTNKTLLGVVTPIKKRDICSIFTEIHLLLLLHNITTVTRNQIRIPPP